MTGRRLLIHAFFLYLLPLVVAAFGLSLLSALLLLLLLLLWRWAISLSALLLPAGTPEFELETISASHFVEKVRWCMDRLGLDYTERPAGGALGVFFTGRTVPVLKFRTGAVRSSIGNSPEILRYLWGRYGSESDDRAKFLQPTAQRLEFEGRIDRVAVDLQVWVYYHILADRDLTLRAWGIDSPDIPRWQKVVLRLAHPLLRVLIRKSFRISPQHHARALAHIGALLQNVEARLEDGRRSILGGDTINYTDLSFAAILGLLMQPEGYGGGRADAVRVPLDRFPAAMRTEIQRLRREYPRSAAFVDDLYREERLWRPS